MPYVFPALVAQALEDESIRDYDTAVRRLLQAQDIDFSERNVLIAHQNVTANGVECERGGSETMVGGLGEVDVSAFEGFAYVALGHIHAAYPVGRDTVRYAGSPLCYHFNETRQAPKGPVLVTLSAKGTPPAAETLTISPLHPMREIRGGWEEIRDRELASDARGEYLRIVLEDRRVTPEIAAFFHDFYAARGSVLMELVSEYRAFSGVSGAPRASDIREKAVEELFADFYAERCGGDVLSERDAELLHFAGELQRHAPQQAAPDAADMEKLLAFLTKQEEPA